MRAVMHRRGFLATLSAFSGLGWLTPKWKGPEPVYDPWSGAYICGAADAPKLKRILQEGEAPLPGILAFATGRIPTSGFIPISEMQRRLRG